MNSAMTLSGALDLESTLQFAWKCGLSMDRDCSEQPGGLLALVGAGRDAAEAIAAASGASLANHNAPDQTVLGGAADALERAAEVAPAYGGQAVQLRVAGAFHTSAFEGSDRVNRALIDALPITNQFTPIVGNHSGQVISTAEQLRDELRAQYVPSSGMASRIEDALRKRRATIPDTGSRQRDGWPRPTLRQDLAQDFAGTDPDSAH